MPHGGFAVQKPQPSLAQICGRTGNVSQIGAWNLSARDVHSSFQTTKKAVRTSERPKSREETPKVGNDCEEAYRRNRSMKDALLREPSQSRLRSHGLINNSMYHLRNNFET